MSTWFLRDGSQPQLQATICSGKARYLSAITPTSKDRATITEQHVCSRCGGAGASDRWAHTGRTCYQCGGSGTMGTKATPLYSAEKLAKLVATQEKRHAALKAKKQAQAEQAAAERAAVAAELLNSARATYPEAVAFLEQYQGESEFLNELQDKLFTGFPFTDNMAQAVLKVKAGLAKKQDWDTLVAKIESNDTPITPGRQVISGYVISVKWKESFRGRTLKMLMLDDRGFKVWCTTPRPLASLIPRDEDGELDTHKVRKAYIRFTASLAPSDDDDRFAFATRPAKELEYTPWGGEKQIFTDA